MKLKALFLLILLSSVTLSILHAQTDTLILTNKDKIIGEIKSMDKGVMVFETDYSNSDFKIDWKKVNQVFSQTKFLITLSDGTRYNGMVNSLNDSLVRIIPSIPEKILDLKKKKHKQDSIPLDPVPVPINTIVYLNALDEGFWSRLSLYFDVGTTLTKANDLRQFTFNLGTGYLADRWKVNLTLNNLRSTQTGTEPIVRNELTLAYNYFLQKDWYLLYNLNILSNTEQLLDFRNSNMVGLGKYLVHTNKVYLGFQGGINLNSEKFANQENSGRTAEGFFGVGYNIYDIGDLDLLTSVMLYPSLSTKDRIRSDLKFDIRYEFKFDLYFKVGTTLNYDNQPVEGASDLDYIFQTTIGWKL
ncbi:DUF481 domain-containing protein [Algoriphagus confluentis]|uniref:DUF481 domain-containing protein n=1 Tax=Algoriphagus confluentis TaxID=1697556 RepID=A0ABQ6PT67_9BACT|nr:hypothetical protein Aconfl_38190 [Algoriphagus confluentis]